VGIVMQNNGRINMNEQKITSLAYPTNNDDASNKLYVDTEISNIPIPDLTDLNTKTQNISLANTDATKTYFEKIIFDEKTVNYNQYVTTAGTIIQGSINTIFDGSNSSILLRLPVSTQITFDIEGIKKVGGGALAGNIILVSGGVPDFEQDAIYTDLFDVETTVPWTINNINCNLNVDLADIKALRIISTNVLFETIYLRNITIGGKELINGDAYPFQVLDQEDLIDAQITDSLSIDAGILTIVDDNLSYTVPSSGLTYRTGLKQVKKFDPSSDFIIFEDANVRIDWIVADLQPSFVLKILPNGTGAFPNWVDCSCNFIGGGVSVDGNGDGTETLLTKCYFYGTTIINIAFNHVNYGSTTRAVLCAENDVNYPTYILKLITGDVGLLAIAVVEIF
jgi:hypothetical protein